MDFLNMDIKLTLPIIITLVPILLKPGLITLFTTKKAERLLMSKELRLFYKTILFIFIFYLMPIAITYEWYKSENIYKYIIEFYNYTPLLIITLISVFFIIIVKLKLKIIENWIKKNKILQSIKVRLILVIFIMLTMYYFWFGCGLLFSEFIRNYKNINNYLPILVGYSYIYILLMYNLFTYIKKLSHQEIIKCNLKLSNGDIITNAYLLHLTYGNKIVLGNEKNTWDIKQNIIVPLDKIEYIELLSKEIISWGKKKEIEIENKIKVNR